MTTMEYMAAMAAINDRTTVIQTGVMSTGRKPLIAATFVFTVPRSVLIVATSPLIEVTVPVKVPRLVWIVAVVELMEITFRLIAFNVELAGPEGFEPSAIGYLL